MVSCIYNIEVYNLNDNIITGLFFDFGMPNNHYKSRDRSSKNGCLNLPVVFVPSRKLRSFDERINNPY